MLKAPNHKIHISNKTQIPIIKNQNTANQISLEFWIWELEFIWNLDIIVCDLL